MTRTPRRRVRAGMVGGGPGADIGTTHRLAMNLDGRYDLVAGIFGRAPEASAEIAAELGVAADRVYRDAAEMARAEAARADGIDVVTVATPNDTHHRIARAFLAEGISVVCEKPLTTDSADAADLVAVAAESGAFLAVPHCYSAYAMVREAARRVREGMLGGVRMVVVEHASGWAARRVEDDGDSRARWRTDPTVGGDASVVADLGTHALHLIRYVTGLEVEAVSAMLDTLVPGRLVADNATVRLRLSGDVPATMWASMAATGSEHGLRLRIFGEGGSVEWSHADPERLILRDIECTTTILSQGSSRLSPDATRVTRVGLGHPEGFLEAFANFYSDLADLVLERRDGVGTAVDPAPGDLSIPTGTDGLIGVQFVEAVLASDRRAGAWVSSAHLTTEEVTA